MNNENNRLQLSVFMINELNLPPPTSFECFALEIEIIGFAFQKCPFKMHEMFGIFESPKFKVTSWFTIDFVFSFVYFYSVRVVLPSNWISIQFFFFFVIEYWIISVECWPFTLIQLKMIKVSTLIAFTWCESSAKVGCLISPNFHTQTAIWNVWTPFEYFPRIKLDE